MTVAWFHFSSSAQGVPTILERPNTTASLPAMAIPVRLMSSSTPFGVQGNRPLKSPTAILPSLTVLSPSTSFSDDTESVIRCELILLVESKGICTMMPWNFGFMFSPLIWKVSLSLQSHLSIECLHNARTLLNSSPSVIDLGS